MASKVNTPGGNVTTYDPGGQQTTQELGLSIGPGNKAQSGQPVEANRFNVPNDGTLDPSIDTFGPHGRVSITRSDNFQVHGLEIVQIAGATHFPGVYISDDPALGEVLSIEIFPTNPITDRNHILSNGKLTFLCNGIPGDNGGYRFTKGPGASLATVNFEGRTSPATDALASQNGSIFQGAGVPNNANGVNGDIYFRTDTPAVANQRIYIKSAGAWIGIV